MPVFCFSKMLRNFHSFVNQQLMVSSTICLFHADIKSVAICMYDSYSRK